MPLYHKVKNYTLKKRCATVHQIGTPLYIAQDYAQAYYIQLVACSHGVIIH